VLLLLTLSSSFDKTDDADADLYKVEEGSIRETLLSVIKPFKKRRISSKTVLLVDLINI
jgi:hypothetical protein